jgi:ribosomal protein S18 acetylase RimI-like enzyme
MDIRVIPAFQTYPLRHVLLYPQRQVQEVVYPGDEDPDAVHLGLFIGVSLVGIASFLPESLPRKEGGYRLRGLAILPAVQRQGVGRSLVGFGIDRVREKGGAYVWCNARVAAVPFYEQLGFRTLSELFDIPGIGLHRRMILTFDPADPTTGAG